MNQENPPINNHFINMLQGHREGVAITELSEAMAKATEAALLTGRPGSVILKFTFKPAGKVAGAVVIEDDITTKLPKAEKVNSIFYFHDGALVRDNPKQLKMEFKPVAKAVGDQLEALREQQKPIEVPAQVQAAN
jgi:hypothetical protein